LFEEALRITRRSFQVVSVDSATTNVSSNWRRRVRAGWREERRFPIEASGSLGIANARGPAEWLWSSRKPSLVEMNRLGLEAPPNLALVFTRQLEPRIRRSVRLFLTMVGLGRRRIWGILATVADPTAIPAAFQGWEQFRPVRDSDLRGRMRTAEGRKRRRVVVVRSVAIAVAFLGFDVAFIAYEATHR
jgi:hypothetical protein